MKQAAAILIDDASHIQKLATAFGLAHEIRNIALSIENSIVEREGGYFTLSHFARCSELKPALDRLKDSLHEARNSRYLIVERVRKGL
jgi:hypothetical protein